MQPQIRIAAKSTPRTKDRRDFSHAKAFGTLDDLAQLPPGGLGRRPLFPIKNQVYAATGADSNFCTAAATSAGREYQEKVELSMEFQAAVISQLCGYLITQGANPRLALQAAVLYGSLEKAVAPFSLADHAPEFLADWKNWPDPLYLKAAPHEAQSYFDAFDGPHDHFGNLLASLFKAQADNGVVICTTQWYEEWNSPFNGIVPLGSPKTAYGWHDWIIIDWTLINGEKYAVGQNSYGEGYGDHGLFYLSADNINMAFPAIGAGGSIFRDLDPNIVKQFQLHNQSLYDIFRELLFRTGTPFAKLASILQAMFPDHTS